MSLVPPLRRSLREPEGDHAQRVRQMFSRIAGRYDLLNTVLSFGLHRRWRHLAVREARKAAPGGAALQLALDVCCGTGELALEFARSFRFVAAADFSLPMLALARRKMQGARVAYLAADALRLPFAEGSFEAAGAAFSLRNVESVPALLAEMKRVVRPGGVVMTLEFSRPPNAFFRAVYHFYLRHLLPRIGGFVSPGAYRYLAASIEAFLVPEELADLFRRAGLEEVRWRLLSGGVVAVHLGRRPDHRSGSPRGRGSHGELSLRARAAPRPKEYRG